LRSGLSFKKKLTSLANEIDLVVDIARVAYNTEGRASVGGDVCADELLD